MKFQIEFLILTNGKSNFDANFALVLTDMILIGEINLINAREVLR